MPTMEELSTMYCEDYSDQDGADFTFLSYKPYGGEDTKVESVESNLARQVHRIYTNYGNQTHISVYRKEGA